MTSFSIKNVFSSIPYGKYDADVRLNTSVAYCSFFHDKLSVTYSSRHATLEAKAREQPLQEYQSPLSTQPTACNHLLYRLQNAAFLIIKIRVIRQHLIFLHHRVIDLADHLAISPAMFPVLIHDQNRLMDA